jgi:glycosyltransferase involved in cell wall biosynthesis
MKINLITTHYPPKKGGVETHVKELLEFISKKEEIFVNVFTYQSYKNLDNLCKNKRIKVYKKIIKNKSVNYFLNDLRSVSLIEKSIIKSFLYIFLNLFLIITVCFKNKKQFKNSDIIFSVGAMAEALPSYILSIIFRKKLVIEWHTQLSYFRNNIFSNILIKLIFKHSKLVTVNGKDIELEAILFGAKKTFCRKHFINYKIFRPIHIKKYKLSNKKLFVLHAAALNTTKFADILKDSIDRILSVDKNYIFIIVGRGPLEKDFLYLKNKYKENIIFLNNLVSQKKLNYLINLSDIVFSSADVSYPCRLTFESLCAGRPVVFPDVSQHDRNKKIKFKLNLDHSVFKIKPNSESLANFLLKNKKYIKKISRDKNIVEKRRNYIIRNFNEKVFDEILGELKSV